MHVDLTIKTIALDFKQRTKYPLRTIEMKTKQSFQCFPTLKGRPLYRRKEVIIQQLPGKVGCGELSAVI